MRFFFLIGGLMLWLNALLHWQELLDALVSAQGALAMGSAADLGICLHAVLLAALAILSAAPAWQIVLGVICLRLSARE
jgi:hypothetical protein